MDKTHHSAQFRTKKNKKMACCRMRLYAATTSVKNGGIPYGVSLKQDGYMGVYFAQANGKNTARE